MLPTSDHMFTIVAQPSFFKVYNSTYILKKKKNICKVQFISKTRVLGAHNEYSDVYEQCKSIQEMRLDVVWKEGDDSNPISFENCPPSTASPVFVNVVPPALLIPIQNTLSQRSIIVCKCFSVTLVRFSKTGYWDVMEA